MIVLSFPLPGEETCYTANTLVILVKELSKAMLKQRSPLFLQWYFTIFSSRFYLYSTCSQVAFIATFNLFSLL